MESDLWREISFFFLDFLGGSFADGAAAWLNGSNLRSGEIFSP